MIKLRKVNPALEDSQDKETREIQKEYNSKVNILKNCCEEFTESFKSEFKINPRIYTGKPSDWQEKFAKAFSGPMKANRLTSRTSRVLHDIYKNLGKFKKEEEFDIKKVDEYKKAFCFKVSKAKILKGGKAVIKRSAIDNPGIVNYFTGEGAKFKSTLINIPELISKMNQCAVIKSNNVFSGMNMAEMKKNLKSRR